MTIETIVYSVLIAIVVCMFVYVKYSNDRLEEDEKFIKELSKNILDVYDYIHSIEIKQQIKINCNIEELTKRVNEVEEKLCKMKK
jgi:urate oxidase